MPEKKFNWGTFVIGLIVGAVAVWIINVATRPAEGQGVIVRPDQPACDILQQFARNNPGIENAVNQVCGRSTDGGSLSGQVIRIDPSACNILQQFARNNPGIENAVNQVCLRDDGGDGIIGIN